MLRRGLHTWGRSLPSVVKSVILFGIPLMIYICLKKRISLNKSAEILQYARFNGFSERLAKYVTAQSAHETNGWTSLLFITNNNAFGMKYAGQSNAIGDRNGYALYSSVSKSVTDLAQWFARRNMGLILMGLSIKTLDEYVNFLKLNRYFEDTKENYLKGCQYWYKKLFE